MTKLRLMVALAAALGSLALAVPALAASELLIRGGGYGHGIGMSQYGAYGYALHGKDYRFILAHYYPGTSLGAVDPKRIVRVLLADGGAAFSGASRAAGKKLRPSMTYDVHALANGQLSLTSANGRPIGRFAAPLSATGPGPLTVPGVGLYRGGLEFVPTGSGHVETINAVRLEQYVRGVVAAEMPSSWSMQALEAQAVAARTYAITTDAGGSAFDQYASTRSQVYGGVNAEAPRTDAAVALTRGRVVTYHGSPAASYFFSSSGGHTENIENAWSGSSPQPWLRGVRDLYDGAGGDPYHRWRVQLTGAQAASKLGGLVDGSFVGIKVLQRGVSPRVVLARVIGSRGSHTVTGAELEQRLGLLSTWATFTTISATGRPHAPVPSAPSPSSGGAAVGPLAMLMPLVRAMVAQAASVPTLAGRVFPAASGDRIAVQDRHAGGWRTVLHARLAAGGSYSVYPPHPGTYRIVYNGLASPAATL